MGDDRRAFLKTAGAAASIAAVAGVTAQASAAALPGPGADRALWISWYDLPEEGRADYLAWLHATHIPGLLERPGYLWAAHYATVERGTMRKLSCSVILLNL